MSASKEELLANRVLFHHWMGEMPVRVDRIAFEMGVVKAGNAIDTAKAIGAHVGAIDLDRFSERLLTAVRDVNN